VGFGVETREIAAKAAGFNSVQEYRRAASVVDNGVPALVEAMDAGAVSISAAAAVATLPPAEQAAVVANGPAAVKAKAREVREQRQSGRRPRVKVPTPSENGNHPAPAPVETSPPPTPSTSAEDEDLESESFALEAETREELDRRAAEEQWWARLWKQVNDFLQSLPRRGGIVSLTEDWSPPLIEWTVGELEELGQTALKCAQELREAHHVEAESE